MLADPAKIDPLAIAIQDWNTDRVRIDSRPFARTSALLESLQRVATPRLNGIWGERDAVSINDLDRRIAAIKAIRPEADVRVIPGAGHWVAYEAPDAFNGMLGDMLR
jgi:pimeloyl-ACP methyl ester carboxylesterase